MNDKIIAARQQKVVKSNALIQQTRFNLSRPAQQMILYLISLIKPTDTELTEYVFNIPDFCRICGLDASSGYHYQNLKKEVKNLHESTMWITLPDGQETLLHWIERPYLDKGKGTIRIKIDEYMRPYLLQLKSKFTEYALIDILALRGKYAIRLYEEFKSYEYLGEWNTTVDELRKKLFATKYTRWADLKRRVIDNSLDEINQLNDIQVTYKLHKTGKRITDITFYIAPIKNKKEKLRRWILKDAVINGTEENQISFYEKSSV